MRAGRLSRRVTLQSRVETQGSTGEVTWTWADVATVWAAIEPISGREYFSAQQVQSSTDTRIRIRYRHGVTSKMRVAYEEPGSPMYTRYYEINSIVHFQENRRELQLMCRERETDGWQD